MNVNALQQMIFFLRSRISATTASKIYNKDNTINTFKLVNRDRFFIIDQRINLSKDVQLYRLIR